MLKIIDSHVHFWDPLRLRYPWLDELPTLNRAILPDHVPTESDGWQVEGIVFVQADCLPEQGLAEVEWVTELATDADARVRGIVAFAPLEKGEGARGMLETLAREPLVKGVRRLIQSEGAGFAVQRDFVDAVRLLPEYGLSMDLCIRHHQLRDVTRLVSDCPDVNFVLDHVGKPNIKEGELEPWREELRVLAARPNVWCKLSGMVTEADPVKWKPSDLLPFIDHALSVFGIERVMFGSDSPVIRLAASYTQWVETLRDATKGLSEAEAGKLWRENARGFYRL